jgi:transposase
MATLDPETPLPDDIESAHRLIRELLASLHQQTHLNEKLQHQLELLLRRLYGKKSEKLDPDQLLLFGCEIIEANRSQPDPEPESTTPRPAKPPSPGHGRKPLPASLPRRPVLHDVPPEDRPCPDCGEIRRCIGEEIREQLEYIPASMVVK